MADPLLTTLCSICRVAPPRYKCPRCGQRTCSLPCTKKHKAWSDCSGQRDATAYKAKREICTPAGIDHDYNFIHGIGVSMQRTEKALVEDRALVQTGELRPLTVQEVKTKTGKDGRRRKVVVTRVLKEAAKGRVFERFLTQRLAKLNTRIMCAPMGMERQKENKTTCNRRTGRVNWQVEWLVFKDGEEGKNTERTLFKVMDDVPMYRAYKGMLDEQARLANKSAGVAVVRYPRGIQHSTDRTWLTAPDILQEPTTGFWVNQDAVVSSVKWPSEEDRVLRQKYSFYLAHPQQRSDQPRVVTKVDVDECFRELLRDTRVLEFPTIYVLRQGETLPPGFVLGKKDMVKPVGSTTTGSKRKGGPEAKSSSRFAKRRKQGDQDLEDGEVGSDDGEMVDAGGHGQSVGLEAGEVVDEQSFGEEEEEEEEDDDDSDSPTSSSGSDSE